MSIMCRDYKRPCIYKTLWGQSRKSKLFLDQTKTTCLAQHKVYLSQTSWNVATKTILHGMEYFRLGNYRLEPARSPIIPPPLHDYFTSYGYVKGCIANDWS